MKEYTAATVTIRHAAEMSKRGRKAIATWLRDHADFLEQHGHEYSARFRGRYMYQPGR